MKKRGFTLVELLGVIVLLAIITLLAVGGYGKISKNVKEKSYENLVTYIETKASDYANDTGNLLTNVDILVKLGYIDADDEEGNVKSPIDGSRLNCHIVSILKEDNSLYGEYSNEEECNLDNLVIKNLNLGINIYKTSDNVTKGEKLEETAWSNQNVILEAYLGEKINASEVKRIIWQSNIGHEAKDINGDFYRKNEYLITAEQIVNTDYFATIELNSGTAYQAQVSVKIDKQRPIIYETFIEKENEYTPDKKITITTSDGNGSGIYGYYIGKVEPEKANDCINVSYIEEHNNTMEVRAKEEGMHYICIKDNAGNVSEDNSTRIIEVKYIDNIPPVCVWSGESTTWTKDNRTISLTCEDNESGCVLENSISKTYTESTKTEHWEYTIRDHAGNETVCEKDINVYFDSCKQTVMEYSSFGSCSQSCGGGLSFRTVYERSTFGSGLTCSQYTESTSCNTGSCEPAPSEDNSGGGSSVGGCKNSGGTCCQWIWDGNCGGQKPNCAPMQYCVNNDYSCGCSDIT